MAIQKSWQTIRPPARWVEVLITILGLLGLIAALSLYQEAFPEAALELKLSREQIEQRARAYMQARGYQLDGYEFVLTFNEDSEGSYFMQRTLGVPETNRRVRVDKLPLWYWRARWFKPLQKEEFITRLAPDGTIIGMAHEILESAPGAKLSQDDARARAEKFLTEDRQWNLADWERVTASSEDRPGGRTDHHLEWKRRDFVAGEGELRVLVDVQGDEIGWYKYWVKAPESFTRKMQEERSRAGFIGSLSYLIGFLGIGAVTFGAFLTAMQRGIQFDRVGKALMIAVGALGLLTSLNFAPLARAGYTTTEDYFIFWAWLAIGAVMLMIYSASIVGVLWIGGRQIARRVWRYQDKVLPRGADRWIILARSSWRGIMLGGMSGGYVVLFYLIATRVFGAWLPLDSPSTDYYASPAPFLAPLYVGLIPATTEEMTFRLAGIPLVLLATRSRILALLIPGALWANFKIESLEWGAVIADEANVTVCLRADDQVIGVARATIDADNIARVETLFVAPEWRRRYWATALLDELAEDLKARGMKEAQGVARVGDKIAGGFWASADWVIGALTFAVNLQPAPPKTWREKIAARFATLQRMFRMP
ncbi:MAG: GNAT family N-acetyltransferase [Chloroflexi bacterium]|nr:GNAT family N-acetyltransferase [Chloroflexota bacterium]